MKKKFRIFSLCLVALLAFGLLPAAGCSAAEAAVLTEDFEGEFSAFSTNANKIQGGTISDYHANATDFAKFEIGASGSNHYLLSTLTASNTTLVRPVWLATDSASASRYQVVEAKVALFNNDVVSTRPVAWLQVCSDKNPLANVRLAIDHVQFKNASNAGGQWIFYNDKDFSNGLQKGHGLAHFDGKHGTFRNIRLVFDLVGGVYDFYLDDTLMCTDIDFAATYSEPLKINKLSFTAMGNAGQASGLDDVKVYGITAEEANELSIAGLQKLIASPNLYVNNTVRLPYSAMMNVYTSAGNESCYSYSLDENATENELAAITIGTASGAVSGVTVNSDYFPSTANEDALSVTLTATVSRTDENGSTVTKTAEFPLTAEYTDQFTEDFEGVFYNADKLNNGTKYGAGNLVQGGLINWAHGYYSTGTSYVDFGAFRIAESTEGNRYLTQTLNTQLDCLTRTVQLQSKVSPSKRYQVVELDVMAQGIDAGTKFSGGALLGVADNSGNYVAKFIVANNGLRFYYLNPANNKNEASYMISFDNLHLDNYDQTKEDWKHFKMVFDNTTGSFDLYIDGVLAVANADTHSANTFATGVNQLFYNTSGAVGSKSGIDNVKFYDITADEANTMALNAIGKMVGSDAVTKTGEIRLPLNSYTGVITTRSDNLTYALSGAGTEIADLKLVYGEYGEQPLESNSTRMSGVNVKRLPLTDTALTLTVTATRTADDGTQKTASRDYTINLTGKGLTYQSYAKDSAGSLTGVTLKDNGGDKTGETLTVYTAVYDANGRMIKAVSAPLTLVEGQTEYTVSVSDISVTGAKTLKVFVLNEDCQPFMVSSDGVELD